MRQSRPYRAVWECHAEKNYPVEAACKLLHISRAAYLRWASGKQSARTMQNLKIAEKVEQIHTESPDKGYRRINDDLRHDHHIHVNDKRIFRICRAKSIKSTIKYSNHGCTRQAKNPQFVAENLLDRDFHADKPNEKWLTDVTEFKWYEGIEVHKVYLSAILDLYDRRIVAYVVGERNDNPLVFKTFDRAVKANPDAHPLFHSDRGFQYTSKAFKLKLDKVSAIQSMSRIGRCIDNGPIEGFWGIIKSEMYYLRKFDNFDELKLAIDNYIEFYNNRRFQKRLKGLSPIEYRTQTLVA